LDSRTTSLLIITGTMGAGKSAVLHEASDLLTQRYIPHAAVDLDALGVAHLPSREPGDAVMYANLESVCANYASLGVRRFLVARAVENRAGLVLCSRAVAATSTVVCRLTARLETMRQRVIMRESGALQQQFVDRVTELNAILDRAQLENFVIDNENRSLTDVAFEMLINAGWIGA
jgi:hypothetical protein